MKADDSDVAPMASPAEYSRIERFFCHSESGCVWKSTTFDAPGGEEISEDTYNDLVKAGFTIAGGGDDLDDILG